MSNTKQTKSLKEIVDVFDKKGIKVGLFYGSNGPNGIKLSEQEAVKLLQLLQENS